MQFSSFLSIFLPFFAEAKAVVSGPSDIYVKTGSEVVITCTVSQGPHELGTIFWYLGNLPSSANSILHNDAKTKSFYFCFKRFCKHRPRFILSHKWHRISGANKYWHRMDRFIAIKVKEIRNELIKPVFTVQPQHSLARIYQFWLNCAEQ